MVKGNYYETGGFPVTIRGKKFWNVGVYMPMPEQEVAPPTRNRQIKHAFHKDNIPPWFVPFTKQIFGERCGQFWAICSKKGKVAPHPVWEVAVDRAVHGRVLLLGDAAHMATPRTGAGAATAMMDAMVLRRALVMAGSTVGVNLVSALAIYNENTVQRGKELWKMCRRIARKHAPNGNGNGKRQSEVPSPASLLLVS